MAKAQKISYNVGDISYGPWEYHPCYGSYSRLVYKLKKSGKTQGWCLIGRQYS